VTLAELQNAILCCSDVAECDEYLRSVLDEIRPLFYGRTRSELCAHHGHLEYEDAIFSVAASPVGQALASGTSCPASILALLIFFMSLFERVRLYAALYTVADLLPDCHLRHRAEAIFQYKNITDANVDFEQRFDTILFHLQSAWNDGDDDSRQQCLDLLQEYFLDAVVETQVAGIDIKARMQSLFQSGDAQSKYPILAKTQVQQTVMCSFADAARSRAAIRSRIVESLHAEACRLAPDMLLPRPLDEATGDESPTTQAHTQLPDFLDTQLRSMGARYEQQRGKARTNFDADSDKNRIYLGTFLPRSTIESWNIFSELLSMPVINAAFAQKDAIRMLDIGSGTGGAVIGFLLALRSWGRCTIPVEITSMDINEDALEKQKAIVEAIATELPFALHHNIRLTSLPFDLEGFVPSFSSIAEDAGPRYDVVTCWKCLCEFYNVNFAQAQGIVRHTLDLASRMLVPYGLCVAADVTTHDNGFEYFSMTLNKEANEHDCLADAVARTVLPVPCASVSTSCAVRKCFTQRRFRVSHSLATNDGTKVAYRVLAPTDFATSITSGFRDRPAFRVNAARPHEACCKGSKRSMAGSLPCGFTGFF